MPFPLSKVGGIPSLKTCLQLVAQTEPQGCSHRESNAHSRSISAGFQLQVASSLQHLPRGLSIASVAVLLTQPSAAVDTDVTRMLSYGCRTSQRKKTNFRGGGGGRDVQKPGRSHPAPEENGDTGPIDPAAPELIHQRQFPVMQTTPVMVPPCPLFSILLPAFPEPHRSTPRRVTNSQTSDN